MDFIIENNVFYYLNKSPQIVKLMSQKISKYVVCMLIKEVFNTVISSISLQNLLIYQKFIQKSVAARVKVHINQVK